ncbi:hypothetical protein RJ640_027271 [Escallonia rubra]|uniref:Retrotransposon Copia-like N-terminal domain-containing protein n=1 Tax=Escallonia rubra TaxID=112253 RepID=A0AA88RIH8_9ASTE|nr:hypothetical protein RJ640_027271 [Escallonia rubra]
MVAASMEKAARTPLEVEAPLIGSQLWFLLRAYDFVKEEIWYQSHLSSICFHSEPSNTSNINFSMDPSNPYCVHHSDLPGHFFISIKLNGANYPSWSKSMIHALTAKNKIGFINGSIEQPSEKD